MVQKNNGRFAFGIFISTWLALHFTSGVAQADPTSVTPTPIDDRVWCTHSTGQRFNVELDGINRSIYTGYPSPPLPTPDALCRDRTTGQMWVAVRDARGVLNEVWQFPDSRWCTGVGTTFSVSDENEDGIADLVCIQSLLFPGLVPTKLVDFGDGTTFYAGTDRSKRYETRRPLALVRVTLQTGNDDLRSDSRAYLIVKSFWGSTRTIALNPRSGETLPDRTEFTRELEAGPARRTIDIEDITEIGLQFDAGRGDGVFRRSDQWEVRGLRVIAIDRSSGEAALIRAISTDLFESRFFLKFESSAIWRVSVSPSNYLNPRFFLGTRQTCRNGTDDGGGRTDGIRFTSYCP